ncbi:MAG: SDR family oxidoreductase [Wenzhouxiangellaceae bacterium]
MNLNQTKAIISGGVSGLGLAVARRLVAAGGKVTLLDVNQDKAEAALSELGDSARFIATDVTDEQAVRQAVQQANEFAGGLNVAISCAGVLGAGRALGREGPMPLQRFATTVQINLVGSFNLAKEAAAVMQQGDAGADGERGVIINTASVAAYEGQIGQAAYSASKAGLVGMTLPLAREFTRFGIRVMSVAPGVFHTPMVDDMPAEVQDALGATIPFPQRLGKPAEFADLVAHIIENTYLNGSTIRLDGAVRLQPK